MKESRQHMMVAAARVLFFCLLVVALLYSRKSVQPELRASPSVGSCASSNIALTPDGMLLLVVNPDSNSLTFIDPVAQDALIELPVGIDPRAVAISLDGTRAFVANQGSDTLAVIDLVSRKVVEELMVGDRPVGVAVSPGDGLLAVAELGEDRIRLLSADDLSTLSLIAVDDRPHGLAFTPDGRHLLISHLLSGRVTVLAVRPFRAYLPVVARAGASGLNSPISSSTGAAMTNSPLIQQISTWGNVAPAPGVVINPAGTRAYLPQTMAHGLGLNTQFDNSVFPKVSVLNLETWQHQTTEHISLPELDQPVGLPWDVALSPAGDQLWVVNAGSNDLSVLDVSQPTQPVRLAHLALGHNPRGIVISLDGTAAYVNNGLEGTVSVIDTAAYTVTAVISSTQVPLPPLLLHGKRLFRSSARPDLTQARWISCNTCHVEGEHDGRTWILQYRGSVPPGATPVITRNTTSLLGMIETYPLRWSAEWDESADSEFSVRFEQYGSGLIHDGEMNPTLGAPNQGRSYDLDALAAYIDSLSIPVRQHSLTPAEQRGRVIFESPQTQCADCHPVPLYTDLQTHDVGTAAATGEWFGPLIDTPTLRFLYDSAPYLHDGSAATLHEVLTAANLNDEHGVTMHLSQQELEDLIAYVLALPNGPPEEDQ